MLVSGRLAPSCLLYLLLIHAQHIRIYSKVPLQPPSFAFCKFRSYCYTYIVSFSIRYGIHNAIMLTTSLFFVAFCSFQKTQPHTHLHPLTIYSECAKRIYILLMFRVSSVMRVSSSSFSAHASCYLLLNEKAVVSCRVKKKL